MVERMRPEFVETRPSVSVVIPCYKYGRYLRGAVGSALEQPGVDVDVLVVDDASPDGSGDVARALARSDPRVRCIVHGRNQGHIATYNEGIAQARGEYVVLLSADDLLTPGTLWRSTSLLAARPDVAFVYGYPLWFSGAVPAVRTRVRSWSVWSGPEWLGRICHRGNGLVASPEVVMRRSVLESVGGYDSAHPHAADFKLWMHASVRGRVGRVNGPDQALYRIHGANMHLTDYAGIYTDLCERRRAFEDFFAAEEGRYAGMSELREVSRRALAREALRWGAHTFDRGEPGDEVAMARFVEFALQTWPSVRGSAAWRACDRRSRGDVHRTAQVAAAAEWSVRHRLRWRRWRRFGT